MARVVWSIDGLDKSGKTHFALTAPGPILYQDVDIGSEGMIEKFLEKKKIERKEYMFLRDVRKGKEDLKKAAQPVWSKFLDDYYEALESSGRYGTPFKKDGVRTIIWDNGADIWSLCLMTHLGKDIQIQPTERTQANSVFKEVVKAAFMYNANLLIIHQLGPSFENARVLERRGAMNKIPFLIQTAVETSNKKVKNDDGDLVSEFYYKITTHRADTNMEGEVFEGDTFDFPKLAVQLVPGTSSKDWK
jgi:hypothetical protein